MRHTDNQEGDEEGSAKEGSGETGSRVEVGCHGGWSGKEELNETRGSCCCYCVWSLDLSDRLKVSSKRYNSEYLAHSPAITAL